MVNIVEFLIQNDTDKPDFKRKLAEEGLIRYECLGP